MPWNRYDNPNCCDNAPLLINWMRKGQRVPKPGEKFKVDGRIQYGPEEAGWAIFFESGGPGVPELWINAYYCPFCGKKLSELEPPDATKRAE
jgi:hypothetical protein